MSNGNPSKRAAGDENQALKKMKYNWLKRVVGGKPAEDNKYNFVVKVMRNSTTYPFCHGVIISSRWILTNALCYANRKAKELSVIAGVYLKIIEKRESGLK